MLQGINPDRNGSDGGDGLLQRVLVPLGQEAVAGAVGGAELGVVVALLGLKQGDKLGLKP